MNEEEKRELLGLINQKRAYQDDREVELMTFGLVQRAYLLCDTKIALLLGANRSGKSWILAVDALIRMLGVIPKCLKDVYPKAFIRPGEFWTSCVDFNSITDIIKKKFDGLGPKRLKGKYNDQLKRQMWQAIDGTEVEQRYKSYDQGREKFQGTSKHLVSFDEEPDKPIYDESFMRTIDCSGLLRLGYTPVKGMTWGHNELWKKACRYISSRNKHGIKEDIGVIHTKEEIELLKDRELVVVTNPSPDADEDITVFCMTIYDNVHLPTVEIYRAEKKYSDDPTNYNARILGRFTKITGANVYPCKALMQRQAELESENKKFWVGDIDEHFRWVPSRKGNLILFDDPKNLRNRLFVIGADVAEGIEGCDYSCAQVLDHVSGEQVGEWWGHIAPDDFARILYRLGRFCNWARLAPERNFHGLQVVDALRSDLHYPRLYGEYRDGEGPELHKGGDKKWGFRSTPRSKELITKNLRKAITEKRIILNDINTIDELITVVYHHDRTIGAMNGCHDDRERALAIAWHLWCKRKPKPFTGRVKKPNNHRTLREIRNYGKS